MAVGVVYRFQMVKIAIAHGQRLPGFQQRHRKLEKVNAVADLGEIVKIGFLFQKAMLVLFTGHLKHCVAIGRLAVPFHAAGHNAVKAVLRVFGFPCAFGRGVAVQRKQPLLLALQDHAEQFLVLRLGKLNAGGKQNPGRLRGGNQNILVAAADHGEKKLVVFVGHFRVLFFQKGLAAQRFLALTQLGRHAVKGFGKFAQIRNGLRIIALGHLLGLPGEVV